MDIDKKKVTGFAFANSPNASCVPVICPSLLAKTFSIWNDRWSIYHHKLLHLY